MKKGFLSKIVAKVLIIVQFISVFAMLSNNVKASEPSFLHFICGDCLEVDYQITSEWDNRYNVLVSVRNTSSETVHNWSLYFDLRDNIYDLYNADLVNGNTFCSKEYNQDINPNETVTFGYTAEYTDKKHLPSICEYSTEIAEVDNNKYTLDVNVDDNGDYQLILSNISDEIIKDWFIIVESNIVFPETDDAQLKAIDNGYQISPVNYNQNLESGEVYIINLSAVNNEEEELIFDICSLNSYNAASVFHENKVEETSNNTTSSNETTSENTISNNETISENIVSSNSIFKINLEGYNYNSDLNIYNLTSSVTSISGNVAGKGLVNSISISINDINNINVWNGELYNPELSWSIEDFGLVTGYNYMTVYVELSNGSAISESYVITNLCRDNIYNTSIDLGDTDWDGITNYEESILGLDANKDDTDGDLLSDIDEIARSFSNPLVFDSDKIDTDSDEITDYDELTLYGTDPFVSDSDSDGVMDGTELKLGLNPLLNDSDQTVETVIHESISSNALTGAELDITCKADMVDDIYIFDMPHISGEGVIGTPVEFQAGSDFEQVKISFIYDEDKLYCSEEDLGIAWLNYKTKKFELLSGAEIDTVNNKVEYVSSHLSTYALVDRNKFIAADDIIIDPSWNIRHGDIITNPDTGHKYMILYYSGSWNNSWSTCQDIDGHLLTISDEVEQEFIIEHVLTEGNFRGYWIGLYSQGHPYQFEWVTEETSNFTNWDIEEPNLTKEYYVEMYGTSEGNKAGKWNNLINNYPYVSSCICEWDGGIDAVIDSSEFIEVESIDYMPGCDIISYIMYEKRPEKLEWTDDFPKDKCDNYVWGYESLYYSLSEEGLNEAGYTYDELLKKANENLVLCATIDASPFCNTYSKLFSKYFRGDGGTYWYDCSDFEYNYKKHKRENLIKMRDACIDKINNRENFIIATADSANLTGVDVFKGVGGPIDVVVTAANFNSYASANIAQAVFVTEMVWDGDCYYFETKYYLYDYYDFDADKLKDLYLFNSAGITKNYLSIGEDCFSGEIYSDGTLYYVD